MLTFPVSQNLIATIPHQFHIAPCWSPHAGGVSALVQSLGPTGFTDDLLFSVFVENYHTVVSHAVVSRTECFLADPAWLDMFSPPWASTSTSTSTSSSSPYEELHYQLLRNLPSFARIFKLLGIARREGSRESLENVFHESLQLAQVLKAMDSSIEALLLDGATITHLDERVPPQDPATSHHPPIDFLYEASDLDLPRIICYHGYFSLVVGTVLVWLGSSAASTAAATGFDSPPVHVLRPYHLELSRRIWAFHRQALKFGPLAFDFYAQALFMTYDQAESEETREWVVALLNQVQRRHRSSDDMWTKDSVWLSDFVRTGSMGPTSCLSPGFGAEVG